VILLVDNYDSFTWNVYQALAALGAEVDVRRNDALDVGAALALRPSAVVISPGPGRPEDAGISLELIARLPASTPLFGVCLGHQALVLHYGGELEVDPVPTHGKASLVHHDEGNEAHDARAGGSLFAGLPNPFPAGRYHSLRAARESLPAELELTAWTEDGLVMAVRHRSLPRYGVQFHPESILTPQGSRILARFLELAGEPLTPR
jgi:anthranilate synthase component 2